MFSILNKMNEPILFKEGTSTNEQIEYLNSILNKVDNKHKEEIDNELSILNYGLFGEEQIKFELMNSHMPMYILHDIYLDDGTTNVQIDYVVVTRHRIYVLECKNLYGNITIDKNGTFIREFEQSRKKIRTAIYSPITQNARHLEYIRSLLLKKRGIFTEKTINRIFNQYYDGVVILANPKTILNNYCTKKEIRNKVIRCDQLVNYIKEHDKLNPESFSDKQMLEYAQSFLNKNKIKDNWKSKYENYLKKEVEDTAETFVNNDRSSKDVNLLNEAIRKRLKEYRYNQAKLENIPVYYIFNDNVLDDLITIKPRNLNELIKIKGFGEYKCNKYGKNIIDIINEELKEII